VEHAASVATPSSSCPPEAVGFDQAEVTDAQSWLSLLVRTLMVQLAHDVNVRAVEMPRARPCGLDSRLRPRRDCAPFTDPVAVAI
jgi:hypothetical protein